MFVCEASCTSDGDYVRILRVHLSNSFSQKLLLTNNKIIWRSLKKKKEEQISSPQAVLLILVHSNVNQRFVQFLGLQSMQVSVVQERALF